jgi:hypothetical protein
MVDQRGQGKAAMKEPTFDLLSVELERLYHSGKYAEAERVALRLVALAEKQFGPDHPDVANSIVDLAVL